MNDNFTRMNKARRKRSSRPELIITAFAAGLLFSFIWDKATANTAHMAANWADVVHVYALEGKQ